MKADVTAAAVAVPLRGWRLWWTAARPRTLPLAATPVLAGTALAWAEGAAPVWGPLLATLAAALLIQVGTNLHNDAADFEGGNDGADRLGPLRVTAAGWATAAQVRGAARTAFGTALLLGVYLVIVGGWPILAIGLASLLAGYAYSGGPRPISHTPFGEIFVWIFFGLVAVAGSYWLQSARLTPAALVAGAALGFPAAAVLMVNNLRDVQSDLRAGRRTLAAVLGDAGARRMHALLLLLPYAAVPLLAGTGLTGAWLAMLSLPASLAVVLRMRGARGAALNRMLADTARAQFVFGLLLAVGCLL